MDTSKTIKVVHLIAPVSAGGGESLLADLLAQSDERTSECVVTVGRAPNLTAALEERNIECWPLGNYDVGSERSGRFAETLGAVRLIIDLRALITGLNPDVLHAHGYPPSFLGIYGADTGVARVYTHHYERQPPGRLERRVLTTLFNRYDALTTVANHLSLAMNSFFPDLDRNFETLRIGIADEFFNGNTDPRWRKQFPRDAIVAVCLGRLIRIKNQQLIIESLAAMSPTERQQFGILIVGSGPFDTELRSMVHSKDLGAQVKFAGQVDRADISRLLASTDFGIFPSTTEASSIAAAESLAAGLPILALDIPAMRETVGSAGILTSADSFAESMLDMISRFRDLKGAALERGELSRMSVVRADWTALYQRVTRSKQIG